LSFIRFILHRNCWSFVVLSILVLFRLFVFCFLFSVSLCLLYSVGNSLVYTCLFLREVTVWSVFPVCALCPAEDVHNIMVLTVHNQAVTVNYVWCFQKHVRLTACSVTRSRYGRLRAKCLEPVAVDWVFSDQNQLWPNAFRDQNQLRSGWVKWSEAVSQDSMAECQLQNPTTRQGSRNTASDWYVLNYHSSPLWRVYVLWRVSARGRVYFRVAHKEN